MFSLWEDCILNTEDITFAQPEAAAASRNVARSAAGYMRTSVIIALCCGVVGLAMSYYLNTSAGAAIVLCCAAVYFVTLPMRRK